MSRKYAILPCNGLDKPAGSLTREIALILLDNEVGEIICPVLSRISDTAYSGITQQYPLLVLDGCNIRCASKLALEKGLQIAERVNISDLLKEQGMHLGACIQLDEEGLQIANSLAERLYANLPHSVDSPLADAAHGAQGESEVGFPDDLTYETYQRDKFIFHLPTNPGFYFNENDVWVYACGSKARIGITDFVQKSLSDIMFFNPPAIGMEIAQFEEAGSLESSKAVFEVISPVSGIITAINTRLIQAPELLNQDPYQQGWIAEIELTDFQDDLDLLHTFASYFPVMKRKVDAYHVR